MSALKVHRTYWTIQELKELFHMKSDLDLRRMILRGEIRLAAHFKVPLHPAEILDGLPPVVNVETCSPVVGWLWPCQEYAPQHDNFDCRYSLLRDRPHHEEGARYFAFPQPVTLEEILPFAVVFDETVKAIQQTQRDDPDRELSTKEEKTRDRLITAMALTYMGWKPWEGGEAALSELLASAKESGVEISRNSAKKHLEIAWSRVRPAVEL